jgi:sortase A
MKTVSKWLRMVELALWVAGLALLAVAFEATFERWTYQAQQERALFQRGPAVAAVTRQRSPSVEADRAAAEAIATAVHATEPDHDVVMPFKAPPLQARAQESASDPAAMGRLEIPRLGVAAIVADGSDDATLARAVGRVLGSALPGQRGNMVLAGHRDTFFRPLREIEVNDRIRFVAPSDTYEYRVSSMRVVEPEETSVLASKGAEELTLVTCYPFNFIGPAPERFVVVATRVN